MAGAAAPFTGSGINPQTLYQDITDSTPPGEELLGRASPFRYFANQVRVINELACAYAVTTTDVGFIEDTSANKSLETSSEAEEAAEDDLAKALNALIAHGMLLGINTSLSTSSNWILKEISPNTVGIAPDGNHYGQNNPIFDYFGDQKTFRVVSEYTTSKANLSITLPTIIGVNSSIQVQNPDGSTTMSLTQNKAYSFRTYFDGITPKIVIENADLVIAETPSASETVAGKIQIATTAQTTAGVDDTSAVTPAKLIEYINTGRVIFSNNTTTPNTQLDYTAGRFFFSSGGSGKVSAGTLNFAINGAGGLDTGSFQANTTYHIFGITNFTSGTSSIIASLNLIPTLPSGYTKYRRIMSVLSNSTPAIRPFIQDGVKITLKDTVLSYSGNINATPTLRSVTVPVGIRVEAWGFAYLAGFNINNMTIVIRDPYANSGLGYGIVYGGVATSIYDIGGNFSVLTNTSSQLYLSITGGSDNEFNLYTQGWIDNNI